MIYNFYCLDRCFLLDVVSGSLFEIDEIAFDLVKHSLQKQGFENDFLTVATTDTEKQVACELNQLVQQGVLCVKEPTTIAKKATGYKAMCLNVCHDCNLDCVYCFASGSVAQKQMMSLDIAKKSIDLLISLSKKRHALEVDFFGGEPTLNFEVVKKTVEYARSLEKSHDKKFRFTITTNALHLTQDMIDFFDKEMYNIVLSVDGRQSIHDYHRPTKNGKSSHSTVLNNIARVKNKIGNKQYYVRGTYTSANLDFSKDVLKLNDLGYDQISYEPVVLDKNHKLAIKQEHLERLKQEYELLAKEYLIRRQGEKWFNFFHFYIDLQGGPCESKRLSGCGAACEYLAVAPNGNIYPCHQFVGNENYNMGNVDNFTTIENARTINKQFDSVDILHKVECSNCFAKYYCSGGCPSNNVNYGTGLDGTYDIACELIKKRIECALAIYAIERTK